jgi:CRP-like cAMP-binding protein
VIPQRFYDLIAQQPFFQGLSTSHLQVLAEAAMEKQFEPGERIFVEGSPANRFYLILQGKVVLGSEAREGGLIPLQTLRPGDDLGWSWLFPPYYLHFSAHAVEPTKVLFFYGTRLREQCEEDHDLGYELMKRVAHVMMQRLQATRRMLLELAAAKTD